MPRRPAAYPPAYREHIIALARAARTSKEFSQEFEPSEQTIRNWKFQAEANRGERRGALTSDEREELPRLLRENRQLKVERDILGKTAALFARESGTIPLRLQIPTIPAPLKRGKFTYGLRRPSAYSTNRLCINVCLFYSRLLRSHFHSSANDVRRAN